MHEQILKRKRLFLYYYAIIIIFTGLASFLAYKKMVPDVNVVWGLVVYIWIFPIVLLLTKKFVFQIFVFVLALLTGIYGFMKFAVEPYSFWNALYSTFRLFILDTDNVFSISASKFVAYPLSIEIARWSAAAYTISTVFLAIYQYLGSSLRLKMFQQFGNHYVISGFNDKSKRLLENLQKDNKKLVLLAEEISTEERQYLEEMNIIVIVGEKGDPKIYRKAGINKAKYIILVDDVDSNNLDELIALKDYYINFKKSSDGKTQVLLHLSQYQSYTIYEQFEKELSQSKEALSFTVRIVDIYRLLAEKLLDEHPLYLGYEERVKNPKAENLHLLFVGFGKTGQQVALQALERGHFLSKGKLRITILDKHIERIKQTWYRNYPKSDQAGTFHFEKYDFEVQALDQFLKGHEGQFTHIFLCLHDDYTNMMEGIALSKTFKDIPIFIKYQKGSLITQWIHMNSIEYKKLYPFGSYEEVLNEDYFINEQLTSLAKEAHKRYSELKGVANVPWNQLPYIERESNHNQMNHLRTKLMLCGIEMVPESENHPNRLTREEFKTVVDGMIEPLAESEHNRWNTFYFLQGWDVLKEEIPVKRKDLDQKLHSCLVSYEELEELNEIMGKDFKQYDRDVIYSLYDMCKTLKYHLIKKAY